jgi:hypothetical protein
MLRRASLTTIFLCVIGKGQEADPIGRLLLSLNLSGGYQYFACSPTRIRDGSGVVQIRRILGCTLAEYNAGNWREASSSVSLPDFSGSIMIQDREIQVFPSSVFRTPLYIGTPTGPSVSDIRWAEINSRTGARVQAWGRLTSDGGSLTISDRPLDDKNFNPTVRYRYWMFKRQ